MKGLKQFISKKGKLSIRKQCGLLGVNRSSYCHKEKPESDQNLSVMRLMDERHLEHPTHGVYQMQDYLFDLGYMVNHKRVRRLLRKMGIMAQYPKKNLSWLGQAKYIRPYLLKGIEISHPNQVWAIDITYIPMSKGFMYLTAIIDLYSRFVVSWNLSNTLDAANSLSVLKEAVLKYGKPGIVNSDQGSQFTCSLWVEYLEEEGIGISMDGKGRALDNVFIERLWRTVKQDYVYLYPAEDGKELFKGLQNFFRFYNYEKSHQGIERQKPFTLFNPAA
jgi:putative transposase